MANCPICKAKIDTLNLVLNTNYICHINKFKKLSITKPDDSIEVDDYSCPACGAILFTDKIDAMAFLIGESIILDDRDDVVAELLKRLEE